MRVEQEQKVTEDARIYAEQDASAQRFAAQVLQVYNFLLYSLISYFICNLHSNKSLNSSKMMCVMFLTCIFAGRTYRLC
jgi:hypothetical protein